MTKICYNALPMSAFTTLQKRVFPAYFRIQSTLLLLTAATHAPHGPFSLVKSPGDLIPLALGGALAALNLMIYGPRTQEAMVQRIHQGIQASTPKENTHINDRCDDRDKRWEEVQ